MIRSIFIILTLFPVIVFSDVTISKNPENGLTGWKLNNNNFELELVQRLPDQSRGFFEARGFPDDIVEDLAQACAFQTIVRNTAAPGTDAPVTVRLAEWDMTYNNKKKKLKLKQEWFEEWGGRVSQSSWLAFRWGMFPNEQTFEPGGDYNWGMITFNVPPGAVFDLKVVWHSHDRQFRDRIEQIRCAPDVDKLK